MLTDTPIRDQLTRILVEVNEYLGTIIGGSITLRAARIEHELPEPTPFKVRALLADWLMQADAAKLLEVVDSRITAEVLIGTLEARHIHTYMQQQQVSSKQHRDIHPLAARRRVPGTTLASRCFAAVLQRRRSPRGPIATF